MDSIVYVILILNIYILNRLILNGHKALMWYSRPEGIL